MVGIGGDRWLGGGGGGGVKDESFLWAGCWIAVMGEFGKDSYQHGPPSQTCGE